MITFKDYVAKVRQTIVEVSTDELISALGTNCLIVDVRESDEWGNGIISGAVCFPRGILEKQLEVYLSEHSRFVEGEKRDIVLYCQSGARSALAVQSLNEMGLCDVKSLAGGFSAWCDKKYPIVSKI